MTNRICIYTASFGDHDEPPELYDAGVDLHCFTDKPLVRTTWRVHQPGYYNEPRARDARMQAKYWKTHAVDVFREQYDYSVWIDASFWVHHGAGFAEHCLRYLKGGLAFYPHPADWRSLEQEAEISLRMPKYEGLPLVEQVNHYRAQGLTGGTLLCGGVIAREHTSAMARLEADWWEECCAWSPQDQLSLPYVLWKNGVAPGLMPGDIYSNDYLAHLWSGVR